MEIVVVILLIIGAIGAVLSPLLRRDAGAPDPVPGRAPQEEGLTQADIDREIARYREALRAGTICARCVQANPPGSRFCSDCGRRLPPVSATAPVATPT